MTTIPDDIERSRVGERPDVPERVEDLGRRAEDTSRRVAAAITGALEGFIEALDRYDVANEGRRAIENTGEITRAAAVEGSEQAQTPEMQQLKHGIQATGERVAELGHTVGDKTHHAADTMRTTAADAKNSVQQNVHDAVESTKYAAYRAKEGVKVRAEAVAETGRRARSAPRHIVQEVSEAIASWRRALVTSIAMMLTLTIFSAIALVVLTIALVVGLNELIGDPAGTFVVALIYVVVAGIAWAVARSVKAKAALEREERMENVREEVRHVVRPVRDAFGGRGRTY